MTMKPITLITGTLLALTMTGPAWTADAPAAATDAVKQQATDAVKDKAGAMMPKMGAEGAASPVKAATGAATLPAVDPAKAATSDEPSPVSGTEPGTGVGVAIYQMHINPGVARNFSSAVMRGARC